jgi:hypothetical protein
MISSRCVVVQPQKGKSETARRLAEVCSRFLSRVEVVTGEIVTSGDFAFSHGRFRVTLSPKREVYLR